MLLGLISCDQKKDEPAPTSFTEAALESKMKLAEGYEVPFKEILDKNKGNVIVIDVWASWCPDCIKGMPKVHKLQEQFPEATYVFLSYDKNEEDWKKGIDKYNVTGLNYLITSKWKGGAFSEAIKLDWIPRYMVVDKEGKIAVFKAIEADDENLIATLKQLK